MKTKLSTAGELEVSQNSRQVLIFAIVSLAIILVGDVLSLWISFHSELSASHSDSMDMAIYWIGNLGLVCFGVWAFWFVPFVRKLVISSQTISIVDRLVFKSRTTSYPLADVHHFGFSYFEQYREVGSGALIQMHLRSGQTVRLMKLTSVSQCKAAHAAMEEWFTARGQPEMVYELP